MTQGTSKDTGRLLQPLERIRQAITDILTTPLGSRVTIGDYGSLLFDLIDAPGNALGLQKLRAATVDAIKKWEPHFAVTRVDVFIDNPGETIIDISGIAYGETVSTSISLGTTS